MNCNNNNIKMLQKKIICNLPIKRIYYLKNWIKIYKNILIKIKKTTHLMKMKIFKKIKINPKL